MKLELNNYIEQSKKIDANNIRKNELAAITFDISLEKPIDPINDRTRATELNKLITEAQTNLNNKQTSIKKLNTNDKCYACGQHIDNTKSIEIKTTLEDEITTLDMNILNYNQELSDLKQVFAEYQTKLMAWTKNQSNIERFQTLSTLIDKTLPNALPDYSSLRNNLNVLTATLTKEEANQKEVIAYNEGIKNRNIKIQTLEEQNRNFKVRQELLSNDIVSLQRRIYNLTILKKAFSPSGVVAYKLENVVKELENSINRYLSILSDGQFQFEFQLTGEKLNIIIINNGIEKSVESLSGGEFGRVQTSVLLAVRNTLADIGNKRINLLLLDEITGVLDAAGKEKLFEVLSEENEANIMLIAHDYSHPLIPKIEIDKIDNVSSIHAD